MRIKSTAFNYSTMQSQTKIKPTVFSLQAGASDFCECVDEFFAIAGTFTLPPSHTGSEFILKYPEYCIDIYRFCIYTHLVLTLCSADYLSNNK